jgi:hypothetical protein
VAASHAISKLFANVTFSKLRTVITLHALSADPILHEHLYISRSRDIEPAEPGQHLRKGPLPLSLRKADKTRIPPARRRLVRRIQPRDIRMPVVPDHGLFASRPGHPGDVGAVQQRVGLRIDIDRKAYVANIGWVGVQAPAAVVVEIKGVNPDDHAGRRRIRALELFFAGVKDMPRIGAVVYREETEVSGLVVYYPFRSRVGNSHLLEDYFVNGRIAGSRNV